MQDKKRSHDAQKLCFSGGSSWAISKSLSSHPKFCQTRWAEQLSTCPAMAICAGGRSSAWEGAPGAGKDTGPPRVSQHPSCSTLVSEMGLRSVISFEALHTHLRVGHFFKGIRVLTRKFLGVYTREEAEPHPGKTHHGQGRRWPTRQGTAP